MKLKDIFPYIIIVALLVVIFLMQQCDNNTEPNVIEVEVPAQSGDFEPEKPEHCPIGAEFSAHKTGQAIDMVGNGQHLFELIKENAELFHELGVRRLEDPSITPTWLHVDTLERNTEPDSVRVVDLETVTEVIRWKL